MIKQIVEQSPFQLHATVYNFQTNERILAVRAEDVFSSASIIKVPIMLAVLHKVEQLGMSLDTVLPVSEAQRVDFSVVTEQQLSSITLYEALLWMIITSDNSATNVCIDFVGMEQLNAFFAQHGWQQTKVQRHMMDFARQQAGYDNETSAADCERIFAAIYNGTLLSPEMNAVAKQILLRQRAHESLRRYIADDAVKVAHKTGGLDTVDHDAGIFYTAAGDYYIGVFMTNVSNNEQAKRYIGQLSKAVYDAFANGGNL